MNAEFEVRECGVVSVGTGTYPRGCYPYLAAKFLKERIKEEEKVMISWRLAGNA